MKKNHLPLASAITLVAGLALWVCLGGRIYGEQESAAASPASVLGPLHVLKIAVLSTMLTDVGEWGFSALVEVDGQRVLFDTGGRPETVLNNARAALGGFSPLRSQSGHALLDRGQAQGVRGRSNYGRALHRHRTCLLFP